MSNNGGARTWRAEGEGSRWCEGVPEEETLNCVEGRERNLTLGTSEREAFGESEGGGCHTFSGDLGVPPWSGEPGAFRRMETGAPVGDGVASHTGLRGGHRCRTMEDAGKGREKPAAGSGWGRRTARTQGL